jgi:hypothetical protein
MHGIVRCHAEEQGVRAGASRRVQAVGVLGQQ